MLLVILTFKLTHKIKHKYFDTSIWPIILLYFICFVALGFAGVLFPQTGTDSKESKKLSQVLSMQVPSYATVHNATVHSSFVYCVDTRGAKSFKKICAV